MRNRVSESSSYTTILMELLEPLEERLLLSDVPLNVVVISDAVAQARQIRADAASGTIAIIYDSAGMTTSGLVNILASVSAANNGAPIGHLGIVAHGGPGEINLGSADDLTLATLPSQAAALERLRPLLTSDARLDLYSCSMVATPAGKTFVNDLAVLTGAAVFASDNPVGTVPGADFVWEYQTGYVAESAELFSVHELESISQLLLLQPTNLSVSPAFPVATGSAQPFTIYGNNFQTGCTVTLRDLSLGTTYVNRPISSQTSTQIVITPNFMTNLDTWSVEVINPGPASSGQLNFHVIGSSQRQPSSQGVDYSSARPSPAGLKTAGYGFAVRYVSPAGNAKNITSSEAQALSLAGLGIITVFESTAASMQGGYSAGVTDANTAVSVATAAGAPQNFFCYFACDWDATLSDQTAINAYLDGAASVMGISRVGIYGGYWPVSRALNAGKAAKGWQTAAWSGGNQDSRISLYQYAGEVSVAGGACDIDVAYGNDLGQWSGSQSDATPPTISAFSLSSNSIGVGNPVTISYTASDAGGSGLKTAQLWRAPDNGYGSPGTWVQIGSSIDISSAGNGPYQGTFSDTPPLVGNWWYGVHIVDGKNNLSKESDFGLGPKVVTVSTSPVLNISSPAAITEGDTGSQWLWFTVTMSASSSQTVSVNYATSNGTATAGSDYTATSNTLLFTPGHVNEQFYVPILGDYAVEGNETFTMTLSGATNATIGTSTATGTIQNDDVAGMLSLSSSTYSVNENAGTITVAVNRSGGFAGGVAVNYTTSNGTATAGSDFTSTSGTLTFGGGETSKIFTVPITNDSLAEGNETFNVALSSATGGGTLGSPSSAVATILDDDQALPALYINDVTQTEGNSGTKTFSFTVSMSGANTSGASVSYATSNGTATAGTDYVSASNTLTWAAGDTSPKTINVTVNEDTAVESDETFYVNLSNPSNATLSDNQGVGTIQNDDTALPTLSIGDVTQTEGNSGSKTFSFTVSMSGTNTSGASVSYATTNGTATAGTDYVSASGTLTWAAGDTSPKTINVTVNEDTAVESDETFYVNLSNPSNATLSDNQGVGTIQNDDSSALPTLSIGDVTQTEGNSGTKTFSFTVSMSGTNTSGASVSYATSDGTATAGSDYVSASNTLTWAAGDTSPRTINVTVNGDTAVESDETFYVNLSNPSNATLSDSQGVGTIQNDDSVAGLANDNFANRTTITGALTSITATNVGATKETGEPYHAGNIGGKSVWWTWTAPSSGNVLIDTIGSNFDTILGIYTGTSVSGLTTVTSDDDGGGSGTSMVTFNAVSGTTYQIAVDGYGGGSGNISLFVDLLSQVPSVTGISPTSGPVTGGTTVIIAGANLTGATAVYFGTTPASSFMVNSATQITATSPAQTAGPVDVKVTTAGGTSTTSSADQFTYAATATRIISLGGNLAFGSVAVGSTAQSSLIIYNNGTSTLTVSGISYPSGFSSNWTGTIGAGGSQSVSVTFTPTAATSYSGTVTVNSDKTSGTNTTTASGTGTTAALPDLAISSGTPTATPASIVAGGTVVLSAWTVRNQGTGASGTFYNGFFLSTDSVITASDTYLDENGNTSLAPGAQFNWGAPRLTIPASTSPGNYYIGILVDILGQVNENSETNNYVSVPIIVTAVNNTPSVTGLSPASGSTAGGTTVTITGANLTGATAVYFGTAAASSFMVNSATQITATSPAQSAGLVDVKVTTAGGTSTTSSADKFTYAGVLSNLAPYQPSGWSDKIVVTKQSGVYTDSSPLYPTDTLYVGWGVINNGAAGTTATFNTALYVDGNLMNTWSTGSPFAAGSNSFASSYSIGTLSAGTHTLQIVLDSTGVINESNESDNSYTKTITVNNSGGGGFRAKVDYTTGNDPQSTTSADFNGDGKADLAVANYYGNTVSVLLNNGQGAFPVKVDYVVGTTPFSVTSADFNGDGKMDLAVANQNSDSVSVLLNNGDGTFVSFGNIATGYEPISVTSADFNRDGKMDLAVTSFDNTVCVFLGNGNGTFAAHVDYATGSQPTSVTSADFNRDGNADLAVANNGNNTVSVLLGNGDGTFAAHVDYATGSSPRSVTSADFNGDGNADLAVANNASNTVSVLLGNGSGAFAPKVDRGTGSGPFSVKSADFNGDGNADLAVANDNVNTVSVLLGSGNGAFSANVDYVTGNNPSSVTASDFNGDGSADLAVANGNDNTVSILLNTGSGGHVAPVVTASAGAISYSAGSYGAVAVDSGIVVNDVGSATLVSATVTISNNYAGGQDVLGFTNQNGITGSWNATPGVLTLSGSSSVANYQAALRSVTYNNTIANPSTFTRTVSFVVNDGNSANNLSSAATRDITVTTYAAPPGNVGSFTIVPGNGQAALTWSNPGGAGFAGVQILRKIGSYPTSPTDGTNIYNGNGTSTIDTGLINGTTYCYKAFSYDASLDYSNGVTSWAIPTGVSNGNGSVVTVSVSGQSLKITGTGGDDHISIAQTGTGAYTIAGLDGTQVKYGATGISADQQDVSGATRDITIDMTVGAVTGFAGNDTVELSGDFYVGNADLGTHGNLTYKGGSGVDTVDLSGGQVTGNATLTLGGGNNIFNFTGGVMGGSLSVTSGAGDDTITLDGANITGRATLTLGTGSNSVAAPAAATIAGAFAFTATSLAGDTNSVMLSSPTFGGTVSITTGASDDSVDLSGARMAGNVTLSLGAGSNTFNFTSGVTSGSLSVTGTAGDDAVTLDRANIIGRTTLTLGAGANDVEAATAPTMSGAFAFTATSAAGDTNTINLTSPMFGNTVSVRTGASDDTVDLSGAQVVGATTVTLGAGNNVFQVMGSTAAQFGKSVSVMTSGSGNNTVTVGGPDGTSSISGGLTINTGTGDDTIGFAADVAGNLSVNSGTSPDGDTVTGSGGTVTGTATIRTGNNGASGVIDLLKMMVNHGTTLNTGAGSNAVDIEGGDFGSQGGAFTLTGGAGADAVTIATMTGKAPTAFWGTVSINLGAGDDVLNVGLGDASESPAGTGDGNTYAKFHSSASHPTFNGGTGVNSLQYTIETANDASIPNQFSLAPVLRNF